MPRNESRLACYDDGVVRQHCQPVGRMTRGGRELALPLKLAEAVELEQTVASNGLAIDGRDAAVGELRDRRGVDALDQLWNVRGN